MPAEITELTKIVLYLLLTLGGGVTIAVLSILLIILLGALGAWLVISIEGSNKPAKPDLLTGIRSQPTRQGEGD
jgi:hypothetical protein